MKNFTYYNPTRIEFGKEKENNIGQYIKEYGFKKVLLVFGSDRIKKDGLFASVTKSLSENGIAFEELGGVISNPVLSKVKQGIKIVHNTNCEAILSVGGGSVLDSCKTIAAGAKYDGETWDLFTGKAQINDALPVFNVLTLAATGSEMNPFAVVTNEETQEKFAIISPFIYPKVSVINPELMKSISNDYLAYSAVDIIAHSIDAYFSAKYIPEFNSGLVELIVKTVIRTTEKLINNPNDYDARGEFAWASTMALNGLIFNGLEGNSFDTHMIGHAMSALHNTPHGASLSITIPAWMKYYYDKNPKQFDRFAKEVFGLGTGKEGIIALENWFAKIGAPVTLAEADIQKNDIPAIAENANGLAKAWGIDKEYPAGTIAKILEQA